MVNINSTTAKRLIVKFDYDKIYTEDVKSNGGNSGKISCCKDLINRKVVVFVLKESEGNE